MNLESEIGPESVKSIFSDLLELRTDGVGFVIVNKIEPNLQYLSQYEKGLLDDIISEFKATPTKTLVNKTLAETPYMQTPPNNVINGLMVKKYSHGEMTMATTELKASAFCCGLGYRGSWRSCLSARCSFRNFFSANTASVTTITITLICHIYPPKAK